MDTKKSKTILPSLGMATNTQSKVFDNRSVLDETKKVFLDRFQK